MGNIEDTMQKPARYWNVDGIPEIGMGGLWVVLALIFLLPELFPGKPWAARVSAVVSISMVLVFFVANRAIKAVKKHVTYPRTGYVRYRGPGRRAWILGACAAIAGLVVLSSFILPGKYDRVLDAVTPAATCAIAGISFVLVAAGSGQQRFYVLGGLAFVLGLAIPMLHLGFTPGVPIVLLALGLACLISGGITLRKYLVANESQTHE
jgi:hypothetical protein